MENNLHINQLVKEMLFVDEPELYPAEIWIDFYETISIILCDEDLAAIDARYREQQTSAWVRRQLGETSAVIRESNLIEEIYDAMEEYDRQYPLEILGETSIESSQITDPYLASHRIKPKPFEIDGVEFASIVADRPVFVWKHQETKLPLNFLERILYSLAQAGYRKMILIANIRLLSEIPPNYQFPIPYDVLPITHGNFLNVEAENSNTWVS